ncbi:hypothetical protein MAR_037802, partial [Mya arenaria]
MVWKIKRSLEAPANSPITNVDHEASGCPESYCKRCSANVPDSLEGDENNYANVDHEASGCSESYCKRCSANVPDPLEGDENNNAMTCPNIYCHDSLLY